MIKRFMTRDGLAIWAALGLMVMLCAPWMLPTNKLYHQLIIFSLWVPSLLALANRSFRLKLMQPELLIFLVFALWTLLVIVIEGADDPVGRAKVVFYVALTLVGVLLAAQNTRFEFEWMLLWASIIGGFFAAASWVVFYIGSDQPFGTRVTALGVWNTIIMAAHAVGALAILGVFAYSRCGSRRTLFLLVICMVGYALFLGGSQTRGVWIGLLSSLLVMTAIRPSRLSIGIVIAVAVSLIGIALYDSELLLQRGASYRPVLWSAGANLMLQHWAAGLGFHEYLITIPDVDVYKHPHNLFLDTGVRLGIPGLLIFLCLWLTVAWRGWSSRAKPLGQGLLALWVFSSVSLMTDGIGLWLKPNADWLITWLPVSLSIVLAAQAGDHAADTKPM